MGVFNPSTGMPGVVAERVSKHRVVTADGYLEFAPAGCILDGTKTRDPDNPDYNALSFNDAQFRLRAGLLIGKVTATGKFANSVIGITQGALANAGTTITLTVQEAVELNRRLGGSGFPFNITLTGGLVANSPATVRSTTVVVNNINLTNGQVTITSPTINDVQTLSFTNAPAGTFDLVFIDLNGVKQISGPITYSGTVATLIANIQASINTALGGGLVVVASPSNSVTNITLTFSGAGYTGLPQTLVGIDDNNLTSGNGSVTHTTTGSSGAFAAGSLVGDTDGSQNPMTFIPDGWELLMPEGNTIIGSGDLPLSQPPIAGNIYFAYLLPSPTDTGLIAFIKNSMNTNGKFVFADAFVGP